MEKSSPDYPRLFKPISVILLAAGVLFSYLLIKKRRRANLPGSVQPTRKKILREVSGLSESEAEARKQPDVDNSLRFKPVRSRREIWRENVLSIFNLSLLGLAFVQLMFGKPLDALLSIGVLGLNIGINVFQEYFARLRLKDILEDTRPRVTVIRDRKTRSTDANDLVVGDMVAVGPGDELLADGVVIHEEGLIVDQSMLLNGDRRTTKEATDVVFAGSFCMAGHAVYRVEKIGEQRFITERIQQSRQAKEQLTPIEIIVGNVLRILLVILAIFTIILIFIYLNIPLTIPVDMFNEIAGIIFSIAPAGLFFMIIVTYAASTVDLAKFGALVHQARSVEAMAQVNTICFSREGVLTGTKLELSLLDQEGEHQSLTQARIQQILGDYVRSSGVDNKITRTIQNEFPGSPRKVLDEAPYLSVFGWSAINFADPDLAGTYLLGIPAAIEPFLAQGVSDAGKSGVSGPNQARRLFSGFGKLFRRSRDKQDQESPSLVEQDPAASLENPGDPLPENQEARQDEKQAGFFRKLLNRVSQFSQTTSDHEEASRGEPAEQPVELIFAYYPEPSPLYDPQGQPQFPIPLTPLCKVSFSEQIRPESAPVINSFFDAGIGVKIFAAEHHDHISRMLNEAGLNEQQVSSISGADLSQLEGDDFDQAAENHTIFLGLSPEQMAQIVSSLREKGQYVAMVGDAVSDVPALRQANLAAAYQSSSPAAQSFADLLLLENSLRVLERVLDKGQRIVNGLLDILKLYLTQVSYLSLMIIGIGLIGFGFPLRGIQLTIITTVTITIPSLGLTIWANPGVLYGNSLRKSLARFTIPAAITIAMAGVITFFTFSEEVLQRDYAHLAVTYVLVFTGLLVVLFLRPPFRLLVGGAPLSRDRRILMMVIVLAGLFLLTISLSSAILFLHDLLLLEWLRSWDDYGILAAIVILWAVLLLLIWRLWPSSAIWNHQEVSSSEVTNKDLTAKQQDAPENQGAV